MNKFAPSVIDVRFCSWAFDWSWHADRGVADNILILVQGGRGTFKTPDGTHNLKRGSCLLLRPGRQYEFSQSKKKPLKTAMVYFSGMDINSYSTVRVIKDISFLENILGRIVVGDSINSEWLQAALMFIKGEDDTQHATPISIKLNEICERIKNNPSATYNVETLAEESNCTRYHFSRVFKRHVGMAPSAFIIQCRIDEAKMLLKSSDYSVGRIAELLGYHDVFFFSKQFKQVTCLSPVAYKKVNQPNVSSCVQTKIDEPDITQILDENQFERMRQKYRKGFGVSLFAVTLSGEIKFGRNKCFCRGNTECVCRRAFSRATAEALRWGEPTIYDSPPGHLVWAAPLLLNNKLYGGLVACCDEQKVFSDSGGAMKIELPAACKKLQELVEEENLTNSALLSDNRKKAKREQRRAEAIHDVKQHSTRSVFEAYKNEEPALVAAIRQGDRAKSIDIINRVLALLYFHGDGKLEQIKGLAMELTVMMCRTAVEAGEASEEILGANYAALTELSEKKSEEALSEWLVAMLNNIMDSIQSQKTAGHTSQVYAALEYIQKHYDQPLTRSQVAKVIMVSPSHFSRVLKSVTERNFTEWLNQIRVDIAAQMLRRTDKSLLQIALEVGYNDQSYFTKVFRKIMRRTPKEYRLEVQVSSRKKS